LFSSRPLPRCRYGAARQGPPRYSPDSPSPLRAPGRVGAESWDKTLSIPWPRPCRRRKLGPRASRPHSLRSTSIHPSKTLSHQPCPVLHPPKWSPACISPLGAPGNPRPMPLECITAAAYRVRARYPHSPSLLLRTDERDLNRLPPALRRACDQLWLGAPAAALDHEPALDALPTLVLRKGERLLAGSEIEVRAAFHHPGRRFFLPLHFRGANDLDLIALEPRAFSPTAAGAPRQDGLDPHLRLLAAPDPAPPDLAATQHAEPWMALAACLRLETAAPGAGLAPLADFARRLSLHPLIHALALRNLAVILMRNCAWNDAEELVAVAARQFPACRELDFLGARVAIARNHLGAAVARLKRAVRPAEPGEPVHLGSGGESGYRAHALLAQLAEEAGSQNIALHHYLTG